VELFENPYVGTVKQDPSLNDRFYFAVTLYLSFWFVKEISCKGQSSFISRRHTQTYTDNYLPQSFFIFWISMLPPRGLPCLKCFSPRRHRELRGFIFFCPSGEGDGQKQPVPPGKIMIITPAENGIYPFRLPPSLSQMKKSISLW